MENLLIQSRNKDKLTDIIAIGILNYFKNFYHIFNKIILPQSISLLLLYVLFIVYSGEFSLTFFLSNQGKTLMIVSVCVLFFNSENNLYQTIKLIVFNNLRFSNSALQIKFFILNIIRWLLIVSLLLGIFMNEKYQWSVLIFLILNTGFYDYTFKSALKIVLEGKHKRKLKEMIKIYLKTFCLIIIIRGLIIFIPMFVTFSIFIVYEFVRILLTGTLFFFVMDRLNEFLIFILIFSVLYILMNPVQNITVYQFLKKNFQNRTIS